jgi:PTH1 family peptidyl-tRNA hydrolase
MARATRLIFGLGNPEAEYEGTRHNIGFDVVDAIAERLGVSFERQPRGRIARSFYRAGRGAGAYDEATGSYRGFSFGLIRPLSFMNRSGPVVRQVMKKHRASLQDILVIADDIHLRLGALRIRPGGGAGGHNGFGSIIAELDSDNFPRMRLGIGSSFSRGRQSEYVLSGFTEEERALADDAVALAAEAALTFVSEGLHTAMNRFNRRST